MKYLKKFNKFESVIIPDNIKSDLTIDSFETLSKYGEENNFDVVNYEDFYDSIPEEDKKTAPSKYGTPFFALFHPINKRPMFVLVDENAARFIPNFKEIVDDIISHERIHAEQSKRKGKIDYKLPSPLNRKEYLSNKEEIMAFSWTIANSLSKVSKDIKSAIETLDKRKGRGEHHMIWNDIKKYCDEKTIKRYRKYIYLYLEKLFNIKEKSSLIN